MQLNTASGRFRLIALLEGISYLTLFITMILKYRFHMPGPNYVVGMMHGILFIGYVFTLLMAGSEKNWSMGKMALLFLLSLIPFGTFYADAKWLRPQTGT